MRITTQLEKKAKELLHRSIALFFYHCAILFHSVESPYFHKMIEKAEMCVGQGIKQPGRTPFLGKLLQNGLNFINASLEDMKASWKILGYSIMSNGWTNQSSRTLINFLVYYLRGLYVRGSVGVSDKKRDSAYLFNLLDKVVGEVDKENVMQVVYAILSFFLQRR